MKTRNFLIVFMLAAFFSGCVVYSFYPLYNDEDLFANDILTGEWMDSDSTVWHFEHAYKGKRLPENIDSTSYYMRLKDPVSGKTDKREFSVHVVKLAGNYFLDFYLEDYCDGDNMDLYSFHIIPVHTFAKLRVEGDRLLINWFDQEWLQELVEENKIRIRHENNGDFILLTAKPDELQKFVIKYVNSEDAFEGGLEVVLTRQ